MGEMMREREEMKRYHMLFLHELALFGKREEESSAWLFLGTALFGFAYVPTAAYGRFI